MVMMIKFSSPAYAGLYVNDQKEEIDDRFDLDIDVDGVSFSLYVYAKIYYNNCCLM